MKVLSGVYPHGTYERRDRLRGQPGRVQQHPAQRGRRHRDHPPGARAHPRAVDRREHLPRQRDGLPRRHQLGRAPTTGPSSCSPGSACGRTRSRPVKHLGIGKQQLVEIAKALAKDVKLLILDEPTAALNDDDSQHLLDLLKGLQGKGITSIMISHKLNEIERIADAITIIRDGRTIETLDVTRRRRRRGPDHPRDGRPRPRAPVPRPHARHRRGDVRDPRLDRHAPADPHRVVVSKAPTSPSARGEIVGHRRPDGCRPHRAGAQRLRPVVRQPDRAARWSSRTARSSSSRPCTPRSTPASPTSARTARASA